MLNDVRRQQGRPIAEPKGHAFGSVPRTNFRGAPSMMRRTLAAGLGLAVAACGSNTKPTVAAKVPAAVVTPAPQAPPPPPKPLVDPVAALIATSLKHFEAGERELAAGHLDKARQEFDRSVEVLLESPYGARTDARMRQHFDRLIDRVNAYEVTALAQGDGFSETKSEAAPIDEILKNATTFPAPAADDATKAAVKADLALTPH